MSCKVGQSYCIEPAWQAFEREGNLGASSWQAQKGRGRGRGGKTRRRKSNPLLFSFPPNPLPLSTAATQATLIAIKTTPLPTDYTGGYMIFEGKNYFHFWLSC